MYVRTYVRMYACKLQCVCAGVYLLYSKRLNSRINESFQLFGMNSL